MNGEINVIKDVANALSYMHHDCSAPIVHRDISSKNILLELQYGAYVSDFGTARLLKPNGSNWTNLQEHLTWTLCSRYLYSDSFISIYHAQHLSYSWMHVSLHEYEVKLNGKSLF